MIAVPFASVGRGISRRCLWVMAGSMLVRPSWAAPSTDAVDVVASPGAPTAAADEQAWLQRVFDAANKANYQGTVMFSTGGMVSSARVFHVRDGGQRFERVEVLDGRPRHRYRHNEQVLTVWPDTKLAQWQRSQDQLDEFPGLMLPAGLMLADSYELHTLGRERVAGRDAEVSMLRARDRLRFSQRLWTDRQTGLLLRSDLLGPAGEPLETTAFSEVQIGGRPSVDGVLRAMRHLEGLRVLRAHSDKAQLGAEGWALAKPVSGFALVQCTKRSLDASNPDEERQQVLQAVFSDGLAHVSVFIEPYDARRHQQVLATRVGATHTVAVRRGDWWFTVMGEVPLATVQLFESMMDRRQ